MDRRRVLVFGCALLVALAAQVVRAAGQNCWANGFNIGAIGHDTPTACTPVRFWVTTTDPDYCGDDRDALYDDIQLRWDWGDGSSQETFPSQNYGDNDSTPRRTIIGNVYYTYASCGTFTVRAWVWDKGNFAQDISPNSPRLLAEKQVEVSSDCSPPNINLVKPAVDNEYVGGMGDQDDMDPYDCDSVFVKAYITDPSGVLWVRFYVDTVYKGNMTQEQDYWKFVWDMSGTSQGTHRIKDDFEDIPRIKDKIATLPTELAHQPPARPRVRPPYTLAQNYAFYVKRHQNSDWACAGTRSVVHPQVLLTFGTPVGPWGPSGNPRACWSAVLNTACTWMPAEGYNSGQAREAMKRLVEQAYWAGGKNYNGDETHHYQVGSRVRFNL